MDLVLGNGAVEGGGGGGGGGKAEKGTVVVGVGQGQGSSSSLLGAKRQVDLPKVDAEFLRINNNRLEHIQVNLFPPTGTEIKSERVTEREEKAGFFLL